MRTHIIVLSFIISSAIVCSLNTGTANAATVPEDCFTFSTGTITDYNTTDVDCLLDLDIPSTISGEAVTAIGDEAFYDKDLTSVTIPNSVSSIGVLAFYSNLLAEIDFPTSINTISDSAFSRNNLTGVIIPDNITVVARNTFSRNQLTSITLHDSITSIKDNAFGDNNLTSLVLPDSLTEIDNYAFSENLLTSVSLGSSLETIGMFTFDCNRLTSVDLPDSLVSIHPLAFISQSSAAPDCYASLNGPADYDAYLKSIWYAQLYTSNPGVFEDETWLEEEFGYDINDDGDLTDTLGGHIINPANITLAYQDTDGNTIADTTNFTGNGLVSYLAYKNTNSDMGRYYHLGSSYNISPQSITGYTSPAAYGTTFTEIDNEHTFRYSTSLTDSEVLAETGDSIPQIILLSLVLSVSGPVLAGFCFSIKHSSSKL